ncbi:hypothetical protein IMSHALPRED_008558 [Imshaugia aleurites]|uniref:Rhodopsin domain-containing protein n=1 Tax=Imshaugia aleurites TaxID=172621 RepID=A0A8H3FXU1_9LECA|nr:hypothetical protein IMSHALPRED_008558 [Imshaugia aleurites]
MIALTAIAVALRFVSRRLSKARLRWDDWLILIALVNSPRATLSDHATNSHKKPLAWIPSILMIYCVQHFNFGKHLQWATASDIRNFWIYLYASEIIYPISVVLIKCSILSLLYRIFHVPRFKLYAATIGVSVIFWGVTTVAIAIFYCNPINAYWDTQITNKACLNTLRSSLGIQISNIILDVIIMILPLPYLWRSHIPLSSQKAGLLLVFTLGGLVVVAASLRLNNIIVYQHSADFTYDLVDLGVWTAVETNTGILCACVAAMQPLLDFATFGILDTERSPPHTAGRVARPSPEPHFPRRQSRWSFKQWPRHNTAPADLGSGGRKPILNIIRRGRHTATSSWGFNQPFPPNFLDEPLPAAPDIIRETVKNGYQTESKSRSADQPKPPDPLNHPMPIHNRRTEKEYDVERAQAERPTKNRLAGRSRFNTFDDVDNIARAERSRSMRRRMERAGWPMAGERRSWI